MAVVEKINEINEQVKQIFEFTQSNEKIKEDFYEYLSTIGARNISLNQMEKIFLPYIFERKIDNKSILEMYKEEKGSSPILESFLNTLSSIFEIKKILKNGFELYNLINEKTYKVLSLTKMTNFRGVYAGQFIVARIFKLEDEYYIIEISSVLSHSQKEEAYRYAVMKLVHNPRVLYFDNPEKEEEIKDVIAQMYKKFTKTFDKDIILTTNKHADDIIGAFNDDEEIDLSDKGCDISEYKFFHVRELDNNYSNFLENSMGGFASHNETYDVAVMFDEKNGLYAIPFYATFCKIFENKNSVENAKSCVEYFLTNDSIPDTVLNKVSTQYPNFMEVINEIMGTSYTYEELLEKYKSDFLNKKIYSSATVLFCSKAFSEMFDYISLESQTKKPEVLGKVGRNEPCPCGSGKKFKNCCGK